MRQIQLLYRMQPLLFFVLPLLFLLPYVTGHSLMGGRVFEELYLPWMSFLKQELGQGRLPFWNPYGMLGRPVFGEIENCLLYPPRWLLFFNPEYSISLFWLLHFGIGHWGVFRVARCLGLSNWSAYLAGALFMFNGWVFWHLYANHCFIIATVSWLPHLLATLLRAREKIATAWGWRNLLLELFFTLLMLTQAGSPQLTLYSIIFCSLTIICLQPSIFGALRFCLASLFASVGALLAFLPHLWETLILHGQSARAGNFPWQEAVGLALPASRLKEILLGPPAEWLPASAQLSETTFYLGPVATLLALIGAFKPNRVCRSFLLIALLFLCLAMAKPLFLIQLFREIPGAGMFRVPGRFLTFVMLILALLAGFGMESLFAWLTKYRSLAKIQFHLKWLVTAAVLLPLLAFGQHFIRDPWPRYNETRRHLSQTLRAISPDSRPRLMLDQGPSFPNIFWREQIEIVAGRAALIPERYLKFLLGNQVANQHLIDIINYISVRPYTQRSLYAAPWVLTTRAIRDMAGFTPVTTVPPYTLYFDRTAVPKVRFFPTALAVSDQEISREMVWSKRNAITELWYEGPRINVIPSPPSQGHCRYKLPSTDEWEIHCDHSGAGWLWVSQIFYPGWQATVNDQPIAIFAAHSLFQAIPLAESASGSSTIYLRYRPKSLLISLLTALLVLSGGLGLLFCQIQTKSRQQVKKHHKEG